jgi:hypothetical protein
VLTHHAHPLEFHFRPQPPSAPSGRGGGGASSLSRRDHARCAGRRGMSCAHFVRNCACDEDVGDGTDRRTCTQERQQQPLVRYGAERLVDVPARRTYSPPPLRLRRYGGAAPRPGSSPIRGVGGLCTDVARAAAPHWLRPTIIAIWPARAGEAAGRSAQQCFPCCLLDPPIPGSAVDRSLYIRKRFP